LACIHSALINAEGEAVFCKFHWTPVAGTHALCWDEAVKISGADADFHRRDLWEAIEAGAYPEWELGLQVFSEEQAEEFEFDILDPTKIVPEELIPVIPVGKLVLNRNPDNFFAETEQVAFCTAHIIPGIDFTNDPLLQGRIHSYVDTQISRLADRISTRFRLTHRSRRYTTISATACIVKRFRAAAYRTSRTRSAAVVRSKQAA
jgi:catalase